MPAIYFVVQRHHGDEFPALYFDFLPERLTRKLPVDDQKKPIEQPPLAYTLRLDRMPEPTDWRVRPLDELLALYRRHEATGTLPPPKLHGERMRVRTPPGYGLPPTPWPEPGTTKLRPDAGAFIPEGREA